MPVNESGEPVVRVKVSTVRTVVLIAVGILAFVCITDLAFHLTGPKKMTFRASVDGVDVVKIHGYRLWIEHEDFQLPIKIKINGSVWNPAWDGSISASYTLRRAFSPGNPADIKLVKLRGRGDVSILEMPSPDNNQTLAIKLDDGPYGGADLYEFTLSW